MSDDHNHTIRYTVYMTDRYWWGGRIKLVLYGTGSSKQGDELIISTTQGFYSFNFNRVRWLRAEQLEDSN